MTTNHPFLTGQHYVSEFELATEQIKWSQILRKISGFRYMSDDWDDEGAIAPSLEVIAALVDCLSGLSHASFTGESDLPAPDRALLTTDGGIIVEWQTQDSLIELESNEPGHAEVVTITEGREPEFSEIEWGREDIYLDPAGQVGWSGSATSTVPVRQYTVA